MKFQETLIYGKKVWIPIIESRTYIKDPSKAPPGVSLKRGKRGGYYYDTDGKKPSQKEEPQKKDKKSTIDSSSIPSYFESIMDITGNKKQKQYYGQMLKSMKPIQVSELTPEEESFVKETYKKIGMKPKMKDCFANAQKLAVASDGKINYIEGFYMFPDLLPAPMDHAWCEINGKHFDPTRLMNNKKDENVSYFGMKFDMNDVYKNQSKTGMYTSVSRNKIVEFVEKKMDYLYDETEVNNAIEKAKKSVPKKYNKQVKEYLEEFKKGNTSKSKFTKDGKYTPERAELHKNMINEFLSKGIPQDSPDIVFAAGLPGAGKSWTLNYMGEQYKNYITINADDIKERLPEYNGLNAAIVHDESSDVAAELLQIALSNKFNIILDGTMKSYDKALRKVQNSKAKGYSTFLLGIELPTHKSIERADSRFKSKGRFVPYDLIKNNANKIYQSMDMLKTAVDNYKIYNTDNDKEGDPPIRVEKMKENKTDNADNEIEELYSRMDQEWEDMIDDVLSSGVVE
jgi:predicted ABC-type ATPase